MRQCNLEMGVLDMMVCKVSRNDGGVARRDGSDAEPGCHILLSCSGTDEVKHGQNKACSRSVVAADHQLGSAWGYADVLSDDWPSGTGRLACPLRFVLVARWHQ